MIKVGKEPYLECSSKGDKRFSAMYARIKSLDNKTIEEIYQASKIFADGKTGLSVKECKGRKAINMNKVSKLYEKLWELYLKENPELIEELLKYNGYTDIFGKEGCQCQAKSIYRIVSNIRKERGETMTNVKELLNVGTKNKGVKTMKKQELEQKVEEQKQMIADLESKITKLMSVTEEKGEQTMNEEQNKFNVFNYTYYVLAKAYLESGKKSEFTITVRRMNDSEYKGNKYEGSQKVLRYLHKLGGLNIDSYREIEEFDEDGTRKVHYEVDIKDFDIKVKAISKRTGNEYNVLQNALARAVMTV